MSKVVARIRAEHANMARLLHILERQIETFEDAETPDYDLLQEIVAYFSDFPDQCHHPKEDLLAKRLLEAAPERAGRLRGLAEMHEELGMLTQRMGQMLDSVLRDAEIPRQKVAQATREFIDSQRHHMEMEEKHFLPLAQAMLEEKDLEAPQDEIFERQDPLFENQTEKRYRELFETILTWERETESS